MRAVVVLSGGQDSALCLALAVKKYGPREVAAITFAYGQRHSIETKYARRLARHFGIAAHKVVKLDFYKDITSNALMDPSLRIKRGRKCPNTVVEGRNAFFLMAAAVWAKTLGAKVLYTGVSQTDYSGYPDCRDAFIKALNVALNIGIDEQFILHTPLMWIDKAQTWQMADELGVLDIIRHETLTCYNGIPGDGCGECPACKLRRQGLEEYFELRNKK